MDTQVTGAGPRRTEFFGETCIEPTDADHLIPDTKGVQQDPVTGQRTAGVGLRDAGLAAEGWKDVVVEVVIADEPSYFALP